MAAKNISKLLEGRPKKPKTPKIQRVKGTEAKPRAKKARIPAPPRPASVNVPKPKKYKPKKQTQEKISKLKRQAYNKEYKLYKRYGIKAPRPETTRTYKSRDDLKRQMRSLERYLRDTSTAPVKIGGNEGFYITSREYANAQELMNQVNKMRMENYGGIFGGRILAGGKLQTETVEQQAAKFGDRWNNIYSSLLNQQTFESDTIQTREQFERILERLQKQSDPEYYQKKNEQMYNNFIEALTNISDRSGIDASALIEKIRGLNLHDFIELYYRAADDLTAVFFNSPTRLDDLRFVQSLFTDIAEDIRLLEEEQDRII